MSKAQPRHSITKFVDTELLRANVEELSIEELRQEALKNRGESGSVTETRAARSRRMTLIQQMGYDIKHIDDFEPHPNNRFSIVQEEIEELAATLRQTGRTNAIVYRTIPEKPKGQILAGERRWRAHRYNWELTGDEGWAMVLCQNLGPIDDDEAMLQLVLDNISNRVLTPSELAWSMDIASECMAKKRENDPAFKKKHEGRKTREIVAEEFRSSPTTVTRMKEINRNLIPEGKALLDRGIIKQYQALEIAKLDEDAQREAVRQLKESSSVATSKATKPIKEGKTEVGEPAAKRKKKTVNDHLDAAQKNLKKAVKLEGEPDKVMLAQMKVYLMELEEKLNSGQE